MGTKTNKKIVSEADDVLKDVLETEESYLEDIEDITKDITEKPEDKYVTPDKVVKVSKQTEEVEEETIEESIERSLQVSAKLELEKERKAKLEELASKRITSVSVRETDRRKKILMSLRYNVEDMHKVCLTHFSEDELDSAISLRKMFYTRLKEGAEFSLMYNLGVKAIDEYEKSYSLVREEV